MEHIDISYEDFLQYYQERIDNIIINDNGTDSHFQSYIFGKSDKVIVYHIGDTPRNNIHNYKTISEFKNDLDRDKSMTLNSDIDLKKNVKNYMVKDIIEKEFQEQN